MNITKLAFLAMDNASEGISISDARLPDNPLIFVNKGFVRMTGYSSEEALNGNCRFLQGEETDLDTIATIRTAVKNKIAIQVELINYRKNGELFWNHLSITPIYNDENELTHYIGVQDDVTEIKNKQRLEQELREQKLTAKVIIKAEIKERHRIGMDLHDNISQMLGMVKLYLGMAQKKEVYDTNLVKRSYELLQDTIEEVRQLSRKLVSPVDENSLTTILLQLVSTTQSAVDFSINFNAEEFIPELLSDTEQLVIFRVVQEQLNNIIKYASASTVFIDLFTLNGICRLTITDNGIGFNTAVSYEGIGLINMRNRVEAVSGILEIVSSHGNGTKLAVEIKLSNAAKLGLL